MDKIERTGNRENFGIENRRVMKAVPEKSSWGGYPSRRRKMLNLMGLICFIAVWIFILVAFFRG